MSDSVTNVQIEDVLSSIRKLVSEEVRAQTKETRKPSSSQDHDPAQPERQAEAPPPSEDRLLLTPALRVQPGTSRERSEEAPFTHAEEPQEEADLLDLMARVRAAGAKQATIDAKRPAGIAPVNRPKPPEPIMPATEEAVRSALFALGDNIRASILTSEPDAPASRPTPPARAAAGEAPAQARGIRPDEPAAPPVQTPPASIAGDDMPRLDARDTLAFAGRDDRVAKSEDEDNSGTVPKFLHRSGITSLGQRIAEVESVVSTSGGDWEPEADEEAEAAPGPQTSAVPWDDPEAERDLVASEVSETQSHDDLADDLSGDLSSDLAGDLSADLSGDLSADLSTDMPDDGTNWAVDPDPVERDFQDIPTFSRRRPMPEPVETMRDPEPVRETGEILSTRALDDIVDTTEDEIVETHDDAATLDALSAVIAEEDKVPLDESEVEDFAAAAPEEAVAAPAEDTDDADRAEETEGDAAAYPDEAPYIDVDADAEEAGDFDTYVAQAEDMVAAETYDEDLQTLASEETTLIDEEMLRDLVSEIVRQELQGALGERITRNVRKLVRREIHRALSAQDLT